MSVPSTALRQVVMDAFACVVDVDATKVDDELDLMDLGLDSLDLVTVAIEIEDRLGVGVPADVLDEIAEMDEDTTFGHLLRIIARWDQGSRPGESIDPVIVDQPQP